ncbi:type II toxin-antitoxin system HicB family antitoxin [Candidatus Magnetomonas plexicatena]|uniref:type II toxin-antitoxin system HicB family antitoxin n=1 Tax=Candidatus Magnetomonas plexicatena TaxID=2552947 RepID=UPI001C78C7B5|nr:type II toxin-antitoxin system HicB family antitoxin [Nitrospirales bacterium LBB_01]
MSHKVSVLIEKDDSGYYAYCPALDGCQSQGDSFEEVLSNIKEAIELYIETLSEEERQEYLSKEILTTEVATSA